MKKSLIKSLFAAARKCRPKALARVKPKKERAPPKGVIRWLRRQQINCFIDEPGIAQSFCVERRWLFQVPGKAFILTEEGLRAAHPWAVDFFFRHDRRIWEGICPHGVGHPIHYDPKDKAAGVHGCDGCCSGGTN